MKILLIAVLVLLMMHRTNAANILSVYCGTSDSVCTAIDANSHCRGANCACNTGYVVDGGDNCVAVIGAFKCNPSNDLCPYNDANSYCSGITCACNRGYIEQNNVCVKIIGEFTCDLSSDLCPTHDANSACSESVCACNTHYAEEDNVCVQRMYQRGLGTGKPSKPTITLNKVPSVGESATLTCTSSHSRSLTYNWRVDSVDNPIESRYSYSTNKNTLTLSNIVKDDACKQFTCTATEDVTDGYTSSRSDSFTFDVHYGPQNMNFNPIANSYESVENSNIDPVACEATCNPTCSFQWTKIGQAGIASNTAVLSLETLTRSEAGTYRCTSTRSAGYTHTKDLTVSVIYGPDTANVNEQSPYSITEGDTNINIECSSDCYPECNYIWTNLTSDTSVSVNGVLSLGTVNRYTAGDYKCMSNNIAAQLTKSAETVVTIIVSYGPDTANINVQSPYSITERDTNNNIECSSDCYPGCSHTWTNLTSGTSISANSVLSIGTVNRYMAGDYKCISSNIAAHITKTSEATITIIVKYAPDVSTRLSKTNTREGENLTLFCDGVGVPPTNYLRLLQTWNNIEIPNSNKALSGTQQYSSIHFSSLKLDDTGTYTCVLTNGVRNIFGELNQLSSRDILVEVSPKVLTDELRFKGSTGGTARVHISFYSYPALTDLTFTKYDETDVSSGTYNVSEQLVKTTFYGKSVLLNGSTFDLVMDNLKENDFGSYTLKLTNVIGTTDIVAFIIAEGKPSPPKIFRYLSDNSIPTFVWEKNFNGGKIQSFVIQISTAGTEIWTNYTNIQENDEQYQINSTFYMAKISGLQPGNYTARILSTNSMGESESVDLGTTFEVVRQAVSEGPTKSTPIAGIAGGSVAAIVVILVVIIVILVLKRRARKKDDIQKTRRFRIAGYDDDESEVNTVNPMYLPADEIIDLTYPLPMNGKKNSEANDVYAVVDKKTKKGKPDENGSKYKHNENLYELPEPDEKQSKRIVNNDVLTYVDLTFDEKPKGQNKQDIIGLDSMTEYVEVDFTQKAEPLSESDEESNTSKA